MPLTCPWQEGSVVDNVAVLGVGGEGLVWQLGALILKLLCKYFSAVVETLWFLS